MAETSVPVPAGEGNVNASNANVNPQTIEQSHEGGRHRKKCHRCQHVSNTPSATDSLRDFRRKLRIFTTFLFFVLITVSVGFGVTVVSLWNLWSGLDLVTNMYSAMFGFMVALVLNILGSLAGIATFHENDEEGKIDSMHAVAVRLLFIASLSFTIISPTSALLPLEIDSKKRVDHVPLSDCPALIRHLEEGEKSTECEHYKEATVFLYLMFSLLLLELFVFGCYVYLESIHEPFHANDDISTLVPEDFLDESVLPGNWRGEVSTIVPAKVETAEKGKVKVVSNPNGAELRSAGVEGEIVPMHHYRLNRTVHLVDE